MNGIRTESKGIITSPYYDGYSSYSSNLDCEITIERSTNPNTGQYQDIGIDFKDIKIEETSGCTFDYVEIFAVNSNDNK